MMSLIKKFKETDFTQFKMSFNTKHEGLFQDNFIISN